MFAFCKLLIAHEAKLVDFDWKYAIQKSIFFCCCALFPEEGSPVPLWMSSKKDELLRTVIFGFIYVHFLIFAKVFIFLMNLWK